MKFIFILFLPLLCLVPNVVDGQQLEPISLSRHDSALIDKFLDKAEVELQSESFKEASRFYNETAMLYWEHNEFGHAVNYYLKSLDLNQQLSNENGIAMINSNLALLYADMKDYEKALTSFISTYSIRKAKGQKVGTISALINMSVVLNNLKKFSESTIYLKEALDIAREMSDPEQMKSCYGMLSETYEKAGMADTAFYYFNLYRSFHEMIQNQKVNESQDKLVRQKIMTELAVAREQHKELELLKSMLAIKEKDSVIVEVGNEKQELQEHLTKKELQLQVIRQKTEIDNLRTKNEMEKRRIITVIISAILGLFTIVFCFLFYAYIQKKKSNNLLRHANITISRKNNELEIRNEEIVEQRDKIEHINTELTDSIQYAKYIQQAILPTKEEMTNTFHNYFIFFQPKDIVSGDFYWANKVGDKKIVAVGDCTGHGVPGAFMSILGMTLLNEIIIEKSITDTTQILFLLRNEIINSLHQKGQVGEQQDGMDIAICSIDIQTKIVQYSGANNPIYVTRKNEFPPIPDAIATQNSLNTMYEIKGDRMPISIYDKMDPFFSHTFNIESGDCLYLFSDGYADQFGGPNGKKLKYKAFKQLLLDIHSNPCLAQEEALKVNYEKWKGNQPQVDDIIVVGIKL